MLERARSVMAQQLRLGDVILRRRTPNSSRRFGSELPRREARGASRDITVNIAAKHSIAQRIYTSTSPRKYTAMDEPPRKRPKTSSPERPPSSPLRKPPRRPSFASPTKASLARNYPNLLPTRTSPRQDLRARGQQAPDLFVDGAGQDVEESSKRPPRAFRAPRRSPLAEAPSVQQNQFSRPAEEALDTEGPKRGTETHQLGPVLEKKKKERARLQREVEELEAHVSRCAKEIQAEQQRAADVALPHAQRADLM